MENQTCRRTFSLEYWLDDGWYVGRLREVPGVFSQAETIEVLFANIQDAFTMMLADEDAPEIFCLMTIPDPDALPPGEVQTKAIEIAA